MMTINFFRSRNLERIDYADVILYFEKDLKCEVIYGEEDVKFIYKDIVFDLEYNFSITKRSRVSNVSFINPEYVNIRFCLDIPEVMPEQASREVIALIDQVCRRFDLGVLYDGIKDVEQFDVMKMMNYFGSTRRIFLEQNPEFEYYTVPSNILTHVSNYHQVLPYLKDQIKEDVEVKKYLFLTDGLSKKANLAIEWEVGTPLIFPPHLDYIKVIDCETTQYLPAEIFFKYLIRHMFELKNYIPDVSLLMLCGKGVKKANSKLKRFKKHYSQELIFKEIKATNLVEK